MPFPLSLRPPASFPISSLLIVPFLPFTQSPLLNSTFSSSLVPFISCPPCLLSSPILTLFLVSLFCSASQTVTQLLLFTVRRACFSLPSVASSFLDLSTVPRADSSPFSPFSRCTCTCVPIFSLFLAPFFALPPSPRFCSDLFTISGAFSPCLSVPPASFSNFSLFLLPFFALTSSPHFFSNISTVRGDFVSISLRPLALFRIVRCSPCFFCCPPTPFSLFSRFLLPFFALPLYRRRLSDLFTIRRLFSPCLSIPPLFFRSRPSYSRLFSLFLHLSASFSISALLVVPSFASLSVHPRLLQSLHCSWCLSPVSPSPRFFLDLFSLSCLFSLSIGLPLLFRSSHSFPSFFRSTFVSPLLFRSPSVSPLFFQSLHCSSCLSSLSPRLFLDLLTVSPAFFRSPFVSPLLFQSSHYPSCPSRVPSVVAAIL